jgi:hypothetical protein
LPLCCNINTASSINTTPTLKFLLIERAASSLVRLMTNIRKILEDLISGTYTVEEAEKRLRTMSLDQIESLALIDVNRQTRTGIPEVVFAESKDSTDIVSIVKGILKTQDVALITRLTEEKFKVLTASLEGVKIESYEYRRKDSDNYCRHFRYLLC